MEFFGKRSLFFALSRSPWWLSLLIAAALFMLVRQFMPDYAALASTLPFLGIAAYAGWRQSRALSPKRAAEALAAVRALSWQEFAAMIEAAFRSEGYAVVSLSRSVADFQLSKGGRVVLVSCKRWKVAQTGIEPLRELSLAKEKAEAQECIYVAAGDVSQNARQFAAENNIRLLCDAELAQFLARTKLGKWNQRQ
jgi:restriction system protein